MVIFDTPPLGTFIEAALLAAKADGTLLVVSSREAEQKKAQEVLSQLKKVNARILGAVLNKAELPHEDYYKYLKKHTVSRGKRSAVSAPRTRLWC